MSVTAEFVAKSGLELINEVAPPDNGFQMYNGGSVEVEVAEFLYGLVRMTKPKRILETGTHAGVSSAYMGMALKENAKQGKPGKLTTLEIDEGWLKKANDLWRKVEVSEFVEGIRCESLKYETNDVFDFAFFDSEPQLRFQEMLRFFDNLTPGASCIVHDLHRHLGHTGIVQHGELDWPFGFFKESIGPLIESHELSVMSFATPRGCTMFQKAHPENGATKLLRGEL